MISVDTKKKELIGAYKNGGREYQRKGEPTPTNTYDFIGEWVVVELRWRLTVDTLEQAGLTRATDSCPDVMITLPTPSE